MKHLFSLIVVLLISVTCKGLESKEITVSSLSMVIKATTEQTHWLYDAAEFVTKNDDRMDCYANTLWNDNVFTVANGFFYKDKGGEFEEKYKIVSCTYIKDNVFKDAGVSETYRLVVNPIEEDKVSLFTTFITIEKVFNNDRTITIVTIPSIDNAGHMFSITVLTNKKKN